MWIHRFHVDVWVLERNSSRQIPPWPLQESWNCELVSSQRCLRLKVRFRFDSVAQCDMKHIAGHTCSSFMVASTGQRFGDDSNTQLKRSNQSWWYSHLSNLAGKFAAIRSHLVVLSRNQSEPLQYSVWSVTMVKAPNGVLRLRSSVVMWKNESIWR